VYFFHGLPGMRRFENGIGDEDFWTAHPPSVPFTVEVSDAQDRYLPYQFSVLLPAHGLYGLVESPLSLSLTPDATWLPVFSTPSRAMPGPSAVIHAQLMDDAAKAPAAWALMTAQVPGSLVMTVSVFYRPALSSPVAADAVLTDLKTILGQGEATAWRDTAHSAPASSFTLQFGKDLVLRSLDSGTGRELPVLLITPA
jgi:hypothetical protein